MMQQKTFEGFDASVSNKAQLESQFIVPPFSVLDTRQGYWQERKRRWVSLGIKGEVGRDAKAYQVHDWMASHGGARAEGGGTSIFDPVLCELMYNWFCPEGGQVLDPFCGGSVRGLVASIMGLKYWGCDLRQEQIDANYTQIDLAGDSKPVWICGDALDKLREAPMSDFIFSCPPYGDLEVYSDDPRDISNMDYRSFIQALEAIVGLAVACLRPKHYACFVVGDYRDKQGYYHNFVSNTIECFLRAGMRLYNEIILVTAVGSLPIRITRQFEAGQKVGKTHQNVLVFKKL